MDAHGPDIWGMAYLDVQAGQPKPVLMRRDDGLVTDLTELIRGYFDSPPPRQAELLERLTGRVLDVGCGVGRHTLWLQERGVQAVGIDGSPGAVAVAKARGCREVHLVTACELQFPDDSFDAAVLMGNGASLGGTIEGCKALFGCLAALVRLRGTLIAEGNDPLVTDNPQHLAYHEANRRAGRPPGQVRVRMEYGGEVGEWFDLMLFEPDRLAETLEQAGWRVTERVMYQGMSNYAIIAEPDK